jgi:fucose 4-O-acetylase-like acetyltransferase
MARRSDLDLARGVAILLVVFGHLVARADPAQVGWYEPLRRAVYSFHMPFFLYLSGLVSVLSGALATPRAGWPRLARARARRLLVPFFALGLLVLLGKIIAARWIFVDNAPSGLWRGLDGLFWQTQASPALSVWYLFVLFVVSMGSIAWLDGRMARLPSLLFFCAVLYAMPLPALAYADRVGTYSVFFVLGAGAGLLGQRWNAFMDRYWPLLLVLLAAALGADVCFGARWPEKLTMLVSGMLAMPAIHGWLRYSSASWPRGFVLLGRYSFMIYLFNTLFIGMTKGVLFLFWSWNGLNFLPFAALLMAAGILGPLVVKLILFRHVPLLDRLTD